MQYAMFLPFVGIVVSHVVICYDMIVTLTIPLGVFPLYLELQWSS